MHAYIRVGVRPFTVPSGQNVLMYTVRKGLGMAILVLIIYIRVCIVSPFVYVKCMRVYTIEHAHMRAYMHMHLYLHEFAFVYTHKCKRSFLRAYICARLHACLRVDLIKMQNAFAHKIFQWSKHTLGSEISGCTIYTVNIQ